MKRGVSQLVLAASILLVADSLRAELVSVRATPRQAMVSADRNNVVSMTWRVATTSDHRSGVSSRLATIVDPGTGEPLVTVNTPFDAGGAGPFAFRETVVLDAEAVAGWVARGVRQVSLVRSFGDAVGSAVEGTAVLRLSASQLQSFRDPAPAELSVAAIRLEFGTGNNAALVDIDEALQLTATLQYTGSGVLRGRWQIADPDSPDGMPVFRTLALVNTNLTTSQRSRLRSPVLPTDRSGRYLVRLSVTGPDGDLVAMASYRVQASDRRRVDVVRGLSPDRQEVDASTVFRWRPSPQARIYRLQVLRADTEFVTGMVLDAATHETRLSDLVQSSLESGQRYLWRISAQDATGRVVGESAAATFTYAPPE
jgi:hypothetical protein